MSDFQPLHFSNNFWVGNRVSPCCDKEVIQASVNRTPYEDKFYGQSWDWTPNLGAAVYGKTDNFPVTDMDQRGNGDFLRVPFRRIPIIEVHGRDELLEIVKTAGVRSDNPSITGVWRGQAKQYPLERSENDLLRLYGDTNVSEPSMLPSASRQNVYFPDIFATWSGILDLYVDHKASYMIDQTGADPRKIDEQKRQFRSSINYRLWGLASAQHHGLPSLGLDCTTDIDVALFFALNTLIIDKNTGALKVSRADDSAEPMIYGLGVFENELLNDELLSPEWLHFERPKAQKAMYFSTAWGNSSNRAAERIFCVLKLVDHASWASPYNPSYIMPHPSIDPFVEFLLMLRDKVTDPIAKELLAKVYF